MATQDRQPSQDSRHEDQDSTAVSPAIGPLPAIYVSQSQREREARQNGAAHGTRVAAGRAAHHLSNLRRQVAGKMSATRDDDLTGS